MESPVVNALIFGASGQDGHYLAKLCATLAIEPIKVSRGAGAIRGDVADYQKVADLIRSYRPDLIFHLAADSRTDHDALFANHQAISTGTLNILEAVNKFSPQSRVFITGSGVQFNNNDRPIREADSFAASSPYALARIHSVYAARYYRSLGLKVYVGYLFHHESPARQPHHISQKIALFARQVAAGCRDHLRLGDMSVRKEYAFAGDVVRAIMTLVRQDYVFEAVIGTGTAYSIEDWLDECFRLVGTDWRPFVRFQNNYPSEYQLLVSEPATIFKLGWSPEVQLPELAHMMVNLSTSEAE